MRTECRDAATCFLSLAQAREDKFPWSPPRPKISSAVGNLHQLNTAEPWLTYTAPWKETYGHDLLHVRLLGQGFVLNSEKTARALLDQCSTLGVVIGSPSEHGCT
ncbi:hypothetical protein EV363DRAFT_852878 [Boletus edulis]|nr:hypothetical protein EV363DRAFT_852878 [Boletus edulis]